MTRAIQSRKLRNHFHGVDQSRSMTHVVCARMSGVNVWWRRGASDGDGLGKRENVRRARMSAHDQYPPFGERGSGDGPSFSSSRMSMYVYPRASVPFKLDAGAPALVLRRCRPAAADAVVGSLPPPTWRAVTRRPSTNEAVPRVPPPCPVSLPPQTALAAGMITHEEDVARRNRFVRRHRVEQRRPDFSAAAVLLCRRHSTRCRVC